ncbi:hypothetical protein GQ53DRAFT_766375 [Thozetella sp. PMI_491]|nr:hypothetical protein GQ53DRAFT_766375 [Thozetella sp. PMI_491]
MHTVAESYVAHPGGKKRTGHGSSSSLDDLLAQQPFIPKPFVLEPFPLKLYPFLSEPFRPFVSAPSVEEPSVEEPFVQEPFPSEPFLPSAPSVSEPFIQETFPSEPLLPSEPFLSKPFVSEYFLSEPFLLKPFSTELYSPAQRLSSNIWQQSQQALGDVTHPDAGDLWLPIQGPADKDSPQLESEPTGSEPAIFGDIYKKIIRSLYLEEGRKLSEVKSYMLTVHGFQATLFRHEGAG